MRKLTEADRVDLAAGHDYRPPDYTIDRTHLDLRLGAETTRVRAEMAMRRLGAPGAPLVLDGVDLELKALRLDGRKLGADEYRIEGDKLIIDRVPARFTLEVENAVHPRRNREKNMLFGLYESAGLITSQGEPFGFRRITYYPDRPDILSEWTVRLEGGRRQFPILLANGDKVESGELPGGRHYAVWHDPQIKPSYLFGMVAGDLATIEDEYVTASGRRVRLGLHATPGSEGALEHAARSIKQAMEFDEREFGREYHLSRFNLVAVDDFFAGAMENTSLNIFKTPCLVGHPEDSPDSQLRLIERVVAHEYFHHWTGNRVTIRDWSHSSLKEALTVYRDQEFMAEREGRATARLHAVEELRRGRLAEDRPGQRPMRPTSAAPSLANVSQETYIKGPEVIRMLGTLVGRKRLHCILADFLDAQADQATSWEAFMRHVEADTGRDLAQFRRWYTETGTPEVTARWTHDPASGRMTVTLEQGFTETGASLRHIPVRLGLIGPGGDPVPLHLKGETDSPPERVIELTGASRTLTFEHVPAGSVPSFFRDMSAPVHLKEPDLKLTALRHRARHDSDPVTRTHALMRLHEVEIRRLASARARGKEMRPSKPYLDTLRDLIDPSPAPEGMLVHGLRLPGLRPGRQKVRPADLDAARKTLTETLGQRFAESWERLYDANQAALPFAGDARARTQRAIRNTALHYLTAGAQTPKAGEVEAARATQRAFRHVTFANNLTDRLEGLAALARTDSPERTRAFAHYRKLWADRPGLARHLDRLDPPSGTKKPDAKKPDAKKPDGKKPRRKKSASKKPNPPRRAVMPGL